MRCAVAPLAGRSTTLPHTPEPPQTPGERHDRDHLPDRAQRRGHRNAVLDPGCAQGAAEIARFQFRARNRWLGGAHNRSTVKDFYAAGAEDASRAHAFTLDAGEPAILLGTDTGPNPAEYLLHALAACVTTSLVYAAAARGVRLTEVESTLEGDLDVSGAMGLSDQVRNGFQQIRMSIRIAGDAPADKLRAVVQRGTDRSVVFDSITAGVPVTVDIVTD